jgi:hypothetical protein
VIGMQLIPILHKSEVELGLEQPQIQAHRKADRKTMGIVIAIIATFIVGGYLLGNISLPNVSMGSIFDPLPIYKNGLGAVNGYVIGTPQIPIIGTIIVAAEQSGQYHTASVGIESDGKYVFQDLKPGVYMLIAFFPDGEHRVMNNIQVEPNSVQTLVFKY